MCAHCIPYCWKISAEPQKKLFRALSGLASVLVKKTIQGAHWPWSGRKLFSTPWGVSSPPPPQLGEGVHSGFGGLGLRHSLGRGGFTWGFLEGGPGATAWADYRVILECGTRTVFFCHAGPIFDKFSCTAQELTLLDLDKRTFSISNMLQTAGMGPMRSVGGSCLHPPSQQAHVTQPC